MRKGLGIFLSILIATSGFNSVFALEPGTRDITGMGNNIGKPLLGTPGQNLTRISYADYDDGIKVPRGVNPPLLPSAREISNIVVAQSISIPNPQGASDMLWQWGQFIDHDLDLTVPQSGMGAETFHIIIPDGDPIFDSGGSGTQIMPFTRSSFDSDTGITTPREQTNVITAFIDGSMVYGSDPVREAFLRDPDAGNGKLKLDGDGLLPLNTDLLPNGNGPPPSMGGTDPALMFIAGDVRVNEQVGLTVIHTLLVREHNWLVEKLIETGEINEEDYDTEMEYSDALYQEAKAIVEGEIQHITYNEFLPMLLGTDPSYKIAPYPGYDEDVDPQVSTEFSTAGFRVGHTLLSSKLERFNADGTVATGGHLSLKDSFFDPHLVKNEGIEPILRGLVIGKSERIDNFVIDEVRNFLFGEPAPVGGFDLASLNIQRGRDHGIPSYNDVRLVYGLDAVVSFDDINPDMDLANKLDLAYGGNVDDVDLWVGGISEPPVEDGMVGPTFAKIIKDQFERSRDGDRFWYQNRIGPEGLSKFQLEMIEKSSLSDIIMRNTEMDMGHSAFLALDVPVGGTLIPIDATALVLANMQTNLSWLVPILVSAVGIGFVITRRYF